MLTGVLSLGRSYKAFAFRDGTFGPSTFNNFYRSSFSSVFNHPCSHSPPRYRLRCSHQLPFHSSASHRNKFELHIQVGRGRTAFRQLLVCVETNRHSSRSSRYWYSLPSFIQSGLDRISFGTSIQYNHDSWTSFPHNHLTWIRPCYLT